MAILPEPVPEFECTDLLTGECAMIRIGVNVELGSRYSRVLSAADRR